MVGIRASDTGGCVIQMGWVNVDNGVDYNGHPVTIAGSTHRANEDSTLRSTMSVSTGG